MATEIKVKADFSGGLDLVFDGKTEITLVLPQGTTVEKLIELLSTQHANSKRDMFTLNNKMYLLAYWSRPGILVLVNEVDWELADKENCVLEAGDKVSFISTLHGGWTRRKWFCSTKHMKNIFLKTLFPYLTSNWQKYKRKIENNFNYC